MNWFNTENNDKLTNEHAYHRNKTWSIYDTEWVKSPCILSASSKNICQMSLFNLKKRNPQKISLEILQLASFQSEYNGERTVAGISKFIDTNGVYGMAAPDHDEL